jgi:hypothetical protein
MTVSTTPHEIPDALVTEIVGTDNFRLLEIASRKSRLLALLLRGGREASPNVEKPLALAKELLAWLEAVGDRWTAAQRIPSDANEPPDTLPDDIDLPTLLSAAGKDVRYLEHLTRGGMGMSPNVVTSLRVLDTLIAKMETVRARWPELQGSGAAPEPMRRPRGARMLDEMISSSEVDFGRDPAAPNPLDRIIADADRRLGRSPRAHR